MSAIERVRPSEPRVPVAPTLALRVAILGGIAMVFFGVIFWSLSSMFCGIATSFWTLFLSRAGVGVHLPPPPPNQGNHVREQRIPCPRAAVRSPAGPSWPWTPGLVPEPRRRLASLIP